MLLLSSQVRVNTLWLHRLLARLFHVLRLRTRLHIGLYRALWLRWLLMGRFINTLRLCVLLGVRLHHSLWLRTLLLSWLTCLLASCIQTRTILFRLRVLLSTRLNRMLGL